MPCSSRKLPCIISLTIPPPLYFWSEAPIVGYWTSWTMVDRIMHPPQDVRALIPETCRCITLHSKKDFAEVSKLRILRQGEYPGLSRWVQHNPKDPKRGMWEGKVTVQKRWCDELWRWRRGHKSRDAGALRSWKRPGNVFSPRASKSYRVLLTQRF